MSTPQINYQDFDQTHWSETEQDNVKRTLQFVQLLMNDHNFETLKRQYGEAAYVQHNRLIGTGIDAIVHYIGALTKRFPEYSYEVKQVFADGPFVILHSHATLKKAHRGNDKQGFNIIDNWKVVDGELIEHWDAVQPLNFSMRLLALLSGGNIKNQNGVF
jgi:predicted SnoaL-like aldol condensation-catalyzing enzyme